DWEQRILDYLSKISEERKFTAQFQISPMSLNFTAYVKILEFYTTQYFMPLWTAP
ncbi:Hypothetical protein FKW44_015700, partial [Caligus rogercresseyi]